MGDKKAIVTRAARDARIFAFFIWLVTTMRICVSSRTPILPFTFYDICLTLFTTTILVAIITRFKETKGSYKLYNRAQRLTIVD